MPEQHRHLANKYEDIVNLQGAEAYRGGRLPTACLRKKCTTPLSFPLPSPTSCSLSFPLLVGILGVTLYTKLKMVHVLCGFYLTASLAILSV